MRIEKGGQCGVAAKIFICDDAVEGEKCADRQIILLLDLLNANPGK